MSEPHNHNSLSPRIPRRTFLKNAVGSAAAAAIVAPIEQSSGEQGTLRVAAESRKMLAGSAVSNAQLHDPQLTDIIARQCGIVVAENEMKWHRIHPEAERYEFGQADELMDFAGRHSMLVRGHNLCWHKNLPDWLADNATHENAGRLLRQHIHTVAGRYAGRIHSWDVINEAIDPDGDRNDGLRDSLWMQLLGPKYVAIAFRAAAEADPKALLTYNECHLEKGSAYHNRRRNITLAFLRWMRENHIPIHALGLQSHFRAHYDELPDWGGLHAFLKEVRKLELQVFITELDIDDTDLSTKPAKREKQVAEFCSDYLRSVLKHPHVTAVLTWGMVSHEAIKNVDADVDPGGPPEKRHIALPFDEKLQPTLFLSSMLQCFQSRPDFEKQITSR